LKFTVFVETLFRTLPPDKFNFRNVRRGQQLARFIDVLPAKEEGDIELVSVDIPGAWCRHAVGPLPGGGRGYRVTLSVDEDAPLGPVRDTAKFTVRHGEQEETRSLRMIGRILGDLAVVPTVVKLEQVAVRGSRLRPVVLTSSNDKPFQVLSAATGPGFETEIVPQEGGTRYTIEIRIAEGAEDGPCATMLEIRTDTLLQPLIRVPVFAYVAPRVAIDPPLVLLRAEDTPQAGTRRVVLRRSDGEDFSLVKIAVDQAFVEVVAADRPDRPVGARFIEVTVNGPRAPSDRRATVVITTDVPGAERLELPVVVAGSHQPG
jgi:hypothetical protein